MGESIVDIYEQHKQLEEATIHIATPLQKHDHVDIRDRKVGVSHKFLYRLGFEELFSPQVWRASVAELMGTAILVFMIDTIIISSIDTNTKTPIITISCFIALIVTILLLATGPISGGHLNPTITLAASLVGLISISRAVIYITAQCIGATVGAFAVKAVVSSNFLVGGCSLTTVAPGPNGRIITVIDTGKDLGLEIFCTFILLFTVNMGFDHLQLKALGPVGMSSITGIVVGLIVFVYTTVTTVKGYAQVGVNPARCVGFAIVSGGHLWEDLWVFWVGPAIACLAFYLYTTIIPRQHFKPRVNKK